MKRVIKLFLFLLISLSSLGEGTKINTINASDFKYYNSAYKVDKKIGVLTIDTEGETGAFWYQNRIDLRKNFIYEYEINLGSNKYEKFNKDEKDYNGEYRDDDGVAVDGYLDIGADGIAFVFQGESNSKIGSYGLNLGFGGIRNAFAVEFDTYSNGGYYSNGDEISTEMVSAIDSKGNKTQAPKYIINDHMAFMKNNGYHKLGYQPEEFIDKITDIGEAEDGNYHRVRFEWNATSKIFTAIYDYGTPNEKKIETNDIVTKYLGGNPFVYFGFTAGTGDYFNIQKIRSTELEAEIQEKDFGDAPNSYGTLIGETLETKDGPSHLIKEGIYLGTGINADKDGKPSVEANLDDYDDGVKIPEYLIRGENNEIEINASKDGYVYIWIDLNGDGKFENYEGQDLVGKGISVKRGINKVNINIPDISKTIDTYMRVRYSTDYGNINVPDYGEAKDGEIEDYRVKIVSKELKLTKYVDAGEDNIISDGEEISYKLVLENTGSSPLDNILLKDNLDDSDFFRDQEIKNLNGVSGDLKNGIKINNLNIGEKIEVNFKIKCVYPENYKFGEKVINIAQAEFREEKIEAKIESSTINKIPEGLFSIKKEVYGEDGESDNIASPGEKLIYSIKLSNKSNYNLNNIKVIDSMDKIYNFFKELKIKAITGSLYSGSDIRKDIVLTQLKANTSTTIILEATLKDNYPIGTDLNNPLSNKVFAILENREVYESNANINLKNLSKISIKKSVVDENKDKVASPGEKLTYIFELKNESEVIGNNVKLQDDLSNILKYINLEKISNVRLENGKFGSLEKDIRKGIVINNIEKGKLCRVSFDVILNDSYPAGTLPGTKLKNIGKLTYGSETINTNEVEIPVETITKDQLVIEERIQNLKNGEEKIKVTALPGDTIGYILSLKNNSNCRGDNIKIIDKLESLYEYFDYIETDISKLDISKPLNVSLTGENIEDGLRIDYLGPGEEIVIKFIGKLKERYSREKQTEYEVEDLFKIEYEGIENSNISESFPLEKDKIIEEKLSNSVFFKLEFSDLNIIKDVVGNNEYFSGDNVLYYISLENISNNNAVDINLEDKISELNVFESYTYSKGKLERVDAEKLLEKNPKKDLIETIDLLGSKETLIYTVIGRLKEDIEKKDVNNVATITGKNIITKSDNAKINISKTDIKLFKTNSKKQASIGDIIPYKIEIENLKGISGKVLENIEIQDTLPFGIKYIDDSAKIDGKEIKVEKNGNLIIFKDIKLDGTEKKTISYLTRVGTGISPGTYTNKAVTKKSLNNLIISNTAESDIEIINDSLFTSTVVIGKVFNDRDEDGFQDDATAKNIKLETLNNFENYYDLKKIEKLGNLEGKKTSLSKPKEIIITRKIKDRNILSKLKITTKSGTIIFLDENGKKFIKNNGDKKKGLSGEKIEIERKIINFNEIIKIKNEGIYEEGIPGVRLGTVEGKIIETDEMGRYHIEGLDNIPLRGKNYIVKVDKISLPKGSKFTTENPRVKTLSKVMEVFNFGVKVPDLEIIKKGKVIDRIGSIFFDFDRSNIKEDQKPRMNYISSKIKEIKPESIIIEGNTDSIGTNNYNEKLGMRRAKSIVSRLKDTLNISNIKEIKILTNGEELPVDSNDSFQGRYRNRRTDILYKNKVSLEENKGMIWTIVDPIGKDPKLNIISENSEIILGKKTWFKIYSNYNQFISNWEIDIYDEHNMIDRIKGKNIDFSKKIFWTPKGNYKSGEELRYVLKVFDKKGNMDKTIFKNLVIVSNLEYNQKIKNLNSKFIKKIEPLGYEIYGKTAIYKRNIPINAGRLRIYGKGFSENVNVSLKNNRISIDNNGNFAIEEFFSPGDYILDFKIIDGGKVENYPISVYIPENYNFTVGIIDIAHGKYEISGNKETLKKDYHYNDSNYTDGRIAFYTKNKYKKYTLTAQIDTETERLKNIGKNLDERDNRTVFKDLDKDKYYENYGDNSNSYRDINTQGKFYASLDWDKNNVTWGNFNTGFTGSQYGSYNRSLYGAKVEFNTQTSTSFGENQGSLKLFTSRAGSLFAHDSFLGTGGSLYYLKNMDNVVGSDKVWIELKDKKTGIIKKNIYLNSGEDYEINYIQGRIILNKPLLQIINDFDNDLIITSNTNLGYEAILNIDYEYYNNSFEENDLSKGLKMGRWFNDVFFVGGTYIDGNNRNLNYKLKEFEATIRKTEDTFIKMEIAESEGQESDSKYYSADGGLSFRKINGNKNQSGRAYSVTSNIKFIDLNDNFSDKLYLEQWYNKKDKEFSISRLEDEESQLFYGSKLNYKFSKRISLKAYYSYNQRKLTNKILEENKGILLENTGERIKLTGEIRQTREMNNNSNGKAVLGAIKGEVKINKNINLYTTVQDTLVRDEKFEKNDRITLGSKININKELQLMGESGWGSRGHSLLTGANYNINKNHNIYINYLQEKEEGRNNLTFGQKILLNEKYSLYQENQFCRNDNLGKGIVDTYGLDYLVDKNFNIGISYEQGNLDKNNEETNRKGMSIYSVFKGKDLKLQNKLEYRKDKGTTIKENQWLTTNKAEYVLNDEFTILGKGNFSISKDKINNKDKAKFIETSIGFSYRPIWNEKINILSKYKYIYDLPSEGQDDSIVDEKSHILSLEEIYEINRRWDIGSKVALKKSLIRESRGKGSWYENTVELYAVKLTYHMIENWDILGEYHWLINREMNEVSQGFLGQAQYHINKNMKLGLGYNFTSFNDDLSRNNYKAKGMFINIIGKF